MSDAPGAAPAGTAQLRRDPMVAASTPAHGRIGDIEVLRAIAILLVVVHHAPTLLPWIRGSGFYDYFVGAAGVDLFFVVSGFVITRDLLPRLDREHDARGRLNVTLSFWTRRIFRLIPAAWFWLVTGLVIVCALGEPRIWGRPAVNAMLAGAAAAQLADLLFMTVQQSARQLHSALGPFFPYWSLSLESQFYLLLPIALLLPRRVFTLAVAMATLFELTRSDLAWPGPLFRTGGLMIGVLLALWSLQPGYRSLEPTWLRHGPVIRVLVVLFLILGLVLFLPDFEDWRLEKAALVGGVLVFIASFDRGYLLPDGRLGRVMLWLGARSYALYLTHIPAYLAARDLWSRTLPKDGVLDVSYAFPVAVTGVVLMLLASDFTHRLIEVPWRRRGRRVAARMLERQPATPGCACRRPGLQQRFDRMVG